MLNKFLKKSVGNRGLILKKLSKQVYLFFNHTKTIQKHISALIIHLLLVTQTIAARALNTTIL